MVLTLLKKLCCSLFTNEIFTIAIRKIDSKGPSLLMNDITIFDSFMPFKINSWNADPMLIKNQGKTYLFFEHVSKGKGEIQVGEIAADLTIINVKDINLGDSHLSYPFVYSDEGEWYLIPETCKTKSIDIYHCNSFPDKWEKKFTLLSGLEFVDSTILNLGEDIFLITALRQDNDEAVLPKIYKIRTDDPNRWNVLEMNWDNFDKYAARSAGAIINFKDKLIRPAQISSKMEYGKGLIFYEINIDSLKRGSFFEHEIKSILSKNIRVKNFQHKISGAHTYALNDEYEIIDFKFNLLTVTKPFRKLHKFIFRKN